MHAQSIIKCINKEKPLYEYTVYECTAQVNSCKCINIALFCVYYVAISVLKKFNEKFPVYQV